MSEPRVNDATVTAVHGVKHPAYPFKAGHCGLCDEAAEHQPAFLEVSMVKTFVVAVADRSDLGIAGPPYEAVHLYEEVEGWCDRIAGFMEFVDGHLEVQVHDQRPEADVWYQTKVVEHDAPSRMLWRARNELSDAARTLSRARYREGHCPELDALTGEVRRLEERLRLMAIEVDKLREAGESGVIHVREPAVTGPYDRDGGEG